MGGLVICRESSRKKIRDSVLFERAPYENTPFKRNHRLHIKPINAYVIEPVYLCLRNNNNNFVENVTHYSKIMSINVGFMRHYQKKYNLYLRIPRTFTSIFDMNNRFSLRPTLTIEPANQDRPNHLMNSSFNMNCVSRSKDITYQSNGSQNRCGSQKKKPTSKICPKLFHESRSPSQFKKNPCCKIVHQRHCKGENEEDSRFHSQPSPHTRVKFSDDPRSTRGSAFLNRSEFDDFERRSSRQFKTTSVSPNGTPSQGTGNSQLPVTGSLRSRAYIRSNNVRQKSYSNESIKIMSGKMSPSFHTVKKSRIIQASSIFGSDRFLKQTQSPQSQSVSRSMKQIRSSQTPFNSHVKTMSSSKTPSVSISKRMSSFQAPSMPTTVKHIPSSKTTIKSRNFKRISSSKTQPTPIGVNRVQPLQAPYMNPRDKHFPLVLARIPDGKQSSFSKIPRVNLRTRSNSPDIVKHYITKIKSSGRHSDIRPLSEPYALNDHWHLETRSVPTITVEKHGQKLQIARWHSLPINYASAANRSVSSKGAAKFGKDTQNIYNKTTKPFLMPVFDAAFIRENNKALKRYNFLNTLTQDPRKDTHFIRNVNTARTERQARSNVAIKYVKSSENNAVKRITAFNTATTHSPARFKMNINRIRNKPANSNKKVKTVKSTGLGNDTKIEDGSNTLNSGNDFGEDNYLVSSRSTSQYPKTSIWSSSDTMGHSIFSSSQISVEGSYRDHHLGSETRLTPMSNISDSLQKSTEDTSSIAEQTSSNSGSISTPISDRNQFFPHSPPSSYPETQSDTDSRTSLDAQSSDLFDSVTFTDSDKRQMTPTDNVTNDLASQQSSLSGSQSDKEVESEKKSDGENSRTTSDALSKSSSKTSDEESDTDELIYPGLSKSSLTSLFETFPGLRGQTSPQTNNNTSSESTSSSGDDYSSTIKTSPSTHKVGDLFLDTWYKAPFTKRKVMRKWNRDKIEKRHKLNAKAWNRLA